MAGTESLPNPTLDSGQFREYVQNEDFNSLVAFYEACKEKAAALRDRDDVKVAVLYEEYKNPVFLFTNCDSSRRTPLHIVTRAQP